MTDQTDLNRTMPMERVLYEVKKVIVDGVDFDINVDEGSAVFDMTISGRIPRSEQEFDP